VQAERTLERLERRAKPRAADLDELVAAVLEVPSAELAARGRALVRRWRQAGCEDPDLALAEAYLTVSVAPASARLRLRALDEGDVEAAAMQVVDSVFRGQLQPAVDRAHAHGWFLDRPEATEAMTYALWALAMCDQVAQAQAIVDAWKRRHGPDQPARCQLVLQFEARLARFQRRYLRELQLLEDAAALAEEFDLETSRVFVEPNVAEALARCDRIAEARELVDGWDEGDGSAGRVLAGYRDMTRLCIAQLEGDHARALEVADRLVVFCRTVRSSPLLCAVCFERVLCAPRALFDDELDRFRRRASASGLREQQRRLRVLEELADGRASLRGLQVEVRGRRGRERATLARLWMPMLRWTLADLFWDRVQGLLQLRGGAPVDLSGKPVLRAVLEAVLQRPGFSIPVGELFEEVWGGRWDPLVHEGKVHVTIHRLRRWLSGLGADGRALLRVADGLLFIDPGADVRVLDVASPEGPRLAPRTVEERLRLLLPAGAEVAPRELEGRLGVSRSALNKALRRLLADGVLERVGAGRSTRYRGL